MSESFEEVYDRLYPQLHNPCALWKAATIKEWLDDLMTAHDREIEQLHKAEYARGYTDGQHSMDAEHYAIAIRLMRLPLDEDSHGNLSQIAGAIWHNDFGWTQGACRALRDELVRLLGGVSEPDMAIRTYDVLRQSCKNGDICETEASNAVESSKYAENYKSGHITDELRKWANENTIKDMVLTTYPEQHGVHGILEQLIAIADRIDEQFERICEQQENALQATIERMADENLTVKDERDHLRRQRDELQKKLDAMREVLDG